MKAPNDIDVSLQNFAEPELKACIEEAVLQAASKIVPEGDGWRFRVHVRMEGDRDAWTVILFEKGIPGRSRELTGPEEQNAVGVARAVAKLLGRKGDGVRDSRRFEGP